MGREKQGKVDNKAGVDAFRLQPRKRKRTLQTYALAAVAERVKHAE